MNFFMFWKKDKSATMKLENYIGFLRTLAVTTFVPSSTSTQLPTPADDRYMKAQLRESQHEISLIDDMEINGIIDVEIERFRPYDTDTAVDTSKTYYAHIRYHIPELETEQNKTGVYNKGGATIGWRWFPDKYVVQWAFSLCCPYDNFCRKIGRRIVDGRFDAQVYFEVQLSREDGFIPYTFITEHILPYIREKADKRWEGLAVEFRINKETWVADLNSENLF